MEKMGNEKVEENQKKPLLDVLLEGTESRREALRRLGWIGVGVFLAANVVASLRFFFPRVLFEPPARFKVGRPYEYAMGTVSAQYKAKSRVWIVRKQNGQFFCLHARCTHLGCTPNWLSTQNKFKCPCHGSGFYSSGDNFEGPAPRPLDRFKMSLADMRHLPFASIRVNSRFRSPY